jgi:hypothetical protein
VISAKIFEIHTIYQCYLPSRKWDDAVFFEWGCHFMALHGLRINRRLQRPMSPLYQGAC